MPECFRPHFHQAEAGSSLGGVVSAGGDRAPSRFSREAPVRRARRSNIPRPAEGTLCPAWFLAGWGFVRSSFWCRRLAVHARRWHRFPQAALAKTGTPWPLVGRPLSPRRRSWRASRNRSLSFLPESLGGRDLNSFSLTNVRYPERVHPGAGPVPAGLSRTQTAPAMAGRRV